jgi:hypothetical protein
MGSMCIATPYLAKALFMLPILTSFCHSRANGNKLAYLAPQP